MTAVSTDSVTTDQQSWPSVRTLAAAGALALAMSGRGNLLLLGGLLALALAEPRSSLGAIIATVAAATRWGTTSMESITGAVTTLGPGVRVGPLPAAAALGLAAVALVLAGVGAPLLPRLANGAAAGAIAVGPVVADTVGSAAIGTLGIAIGIGVAVLLPRLIAAPSDRWRNGMLAMAVLSLALAAAW